MCLTRCSTGTFIENGMRTFLRKCTTRTRLVVPKKNPADSWYQGEIGFFDFYIIPLAKKLADCGVFGVSSDEYLNYAIQNRNEWKVRGQEVVASLIERFCTEDGNEEKKD